MRSASNLRYAVAVLAAACVWVPANAAQAAPTAAAIVQGGRVEFNRPSDFLPVFSGATGLPVEGAYRREQLLTDGATCDVDLTVRTYSVAARSDVKASGASLRLKRRSAADQPVELRHIERRGRARGGRWYQSSPTVTAGRDDGFAHPYEGSPSAAAAAVLPDRVVRPSKQWGVWMDVSITSTGHSAVLAEPTSTSTYAPLDAAQSRACAAIATSVAAPTVRRAVRNAYLAKGSNIHQR